MNKMHPHILAILKSNRSSRVYMSRLLKYFEIVYENSNDVMPFVNQLRLPQFRMTPRWKQSVLNILQKLEINQDKLHEFNTLLKEEDEARNQAGPSFIISPEFQAKLDEATKNLDKNQIAIVGDNNVIEICTILEERYA
jgi:hypothetical protein